MPGSFLRTVIYKGEAEESAVTTLKAKGLTLISFDDLEKLGKEHPSDHRPPKPEDTALVLFGSAL